MQKYIDSWNNQADKYNQWGNLSIEEQVDWVDNQKVGEMETEIEKLQKELLYFKRRTALQVAGWEFSAVSLYDEEGVEGWHWESPKGDDFYEMGDWNSPAEIPEEVTKIADELINI